MAPAPPLDIITLDNIEEKLTKVDLNAPNQLWAIVDMGSNGIRFSITDLKAPHTRLLTPVYADRADISLVKKGEMKDGKRFFPKKVIQEVAEAIGRFNHIAVKFDVPSDQVMLFATEATRSASNGGDLVDAIKKEAPNIRVSILDPKVETLCGAIMGSRSGLVDVKDGALFLDLGGGSVQMAWVDTSVPNYEMLAAENGVSMPYGAAAVTQMLKKLEEDKKKKDDDIVRIAEIDASFQDKFVELCNKTPKLNAIRHSYLNGDKHAKIDLYMCGGGFRGYGSMLMHDDDASPYPIPSINGYTAPGKLFKDVDKMLKVNEKEKDKKIFGMSKSRREQFQAIAVVINAVIGIVPNIGNVTFCGGSNRQGALMMKLPTEIRNENPLDVLAFSNEKEKEILTAVSNLLQDAMPKELGYFQVPTIFNQGLSLLFAKDMWGRAGYSSDSNTCWALNHAVIRDPEAPGLSHLGRALLGLASSARWAGNLGPLDAKLFDGLTSIVENHGDTAAAFWAGYIGAVASVIAAVVPVFPQHAKDVADIFDISATLEEEDKKHYKLHLEIGIKGGYGKGVDVTELEDSIKGTAKKRGAKKAKFDVAIKIKHLS